MDDNLDNKQGLSLADQVNKEFKLTSLALNNKNTVFLLIMVVFGFGLIAYMSLPKELFPEVNMPTIMVQTMYPGNPPEDIENLITRPIEKELKTVKGMKELTSVSSQDVSMIFVKFNPDVKVKEAKQLVKDEVDKSLDDLPEDRLSDPQVIDIDLSEFPVIVFNLSGDYSVDELKEYAEYLQDEMEGIYEVSKVNIKGLNEKEVKVNLDLNKLHAYSMSLNDVANAINMENVSMSGGNILSGKIRRSVRVIGEFKQAKEMEDIIVKHENGNIVYLRDVGEVIDGYEESRSFARLDNKSVVALEVVKKSGENLLAMVDKARKVVDDAREAKIIPEELRVTITSDQSKDVKSNLLNLENSIIMGVLFVVGVLFFFLGLRNALFVGLAIPLSMFMSFVILGMMGATINMMILFSLILALGMLVDNAIVVIENTYRYVDQGYSLKYAAKYAVGEIAMPIISSTLTTLAAFFPLLFWKDTMGEFMKYLPITLIVVLSSSLFVALVILPVLAAVFLKPSDQIKEPNKRMVLYVTGVMLALAGIGYATASYSFANIMAIFAVFILLNVFVLMDMSKYFQNVVLVKLENLYVRFIRFSLLGAKPYLFLLGTFALLVLSIVFLGIKEPNVTFFPNSDPKYINIYSELPIGSDVTTTDSITKIVEAKVFKLIKPYDEIVESVLTSVGEGVKREGEFSSGRSSHKSRITINFVEFQFRNGVSTSHVLKMLSDSLLGHYPGIGMYLEKDHKGPPVGFPVNMELGGPSLDQLIALSDTISQLIEDSEIKGIEQLKIDVELGKPELLVNVNRDKARRFGLSTMQIANAIRMALYGYEASSFKVEEDEYPIQVRLMDEYRYNVAALLNQKVTFRNNQGKLLSIPIASVADFEYSTSYGSVSRKNQRRVVTMYSNVVEGFNAEKINNQLKDLMGRYKLPEGYSCTFTGEQEEQANTMGFLINALAIAIALILLILVTQFNSLPKPVIILFSVLFSTIGVFLGIVIFGMDVVVLMTGIGIVSLAGVVVNNAIVLIDYIDFLKLKRKKELGMDPEDHLTIDQVIPCVIEGGKTRLRPVLLTAITTVLGLVPLAIGLNVNFGTMLSEFDAQIYMGGDNTVFWGPMAWTVIFGLTFATFLTLVIVPVMYLIFNRLKLAGRHKAKTVAAKATANS